MDDNQLMHYGVLGMKWGVRKARPKSTTSSRSKSSSKKVDTKKRNETIRKAASKGRKVVDTILVGSVMDEVFYGGRGRAAVRTAGRAAISSILKKRGYSDIRWYD